MILQFKNKEVNTLWSPNGKKTNQAWRLGARHTVLKFKNVKLEQKEQEVAKHAEAKIITDREWTDKMETFASFKSKTRSKLNKLLNKLNKMCAESDEIYPTICADNIHDFIPDTLKGILESTHEPDFLDWIQLASHSGWSDDLIRDNLIGASMTSIGNHFLEDNQIASMECWEDHIDLDTDIREQINALSPLELEYLQRYLNGSLCDSYRSIHVSHEGTYIRLIVDKSQLPTISKRKEV